MQMALFACDHQVKRRQWFAGKSLITSCDVGEGEEPQWRACANSLTVNTFSKAYFKPPTSHQRRRIRKRYMQRLSWGSGRPQHLRNRVLREYLMSYIPSPLKPSWTPRITTGFLSLYSKTLSFYLHLSAPFVLSYSVVSSLHVYFPNDITTFKDEGNILFLFDFLLLHIPIICWMILMTEFLKATLQSCIYHF